MITADELTQLRKSGAADADILTKYREFDPQHDSDIDTLLKRGETPGAILDGLSRFTAGGNEAPKEDRMASKGVLEKTRGALQFGASNLLAGLGATAKHSGFKGTADVLQSGAKSIAPTDYEAAGSKFDVTSPSTYGYAPRALLEGAPGVITDLAAGAAGGVAGPAGAASAFMASNAARNFGSNVDARMENQAPGANPSTSDYLASGGATAAEAVLSRVGLNPALNGVAKGAGMKAVAQVPGLIAKAAGADAAAGAAGDVVNQVGRTAGTEQGLSVNPKEALNASALAGATGGAIRAARGVGDVTNAVRFKDVDDAAAARVVERMDRLKADTGSPEQAYKSVEMARKSLDTEITDAHSVIKPLLKSKGNDTDTDNTRVLVKDTLTVLRNGGDAPEGALTEIKSRLGDTDEGFRFVSLLEDRQALNNLMSQGRYEKSADKPQGYFGGGITSTRMSDNALDPTAILRSKLGLGAAGSGIAGLSFAGQLGAIAPIMAKVAAAQTALYGGARAIDSATGLKNPAKEFMNRFRGEAEAPQADLPSFRQEALDAKETKATERSAPDPIKLAKARAKQEDRAWKAKEAADKQAQAAEDRKAAEMDKAYQTQEAPQGLKEAQEEALWRQRDQETQKAEIADGEASEGIRAGYSDLLKQAVTKGAAARKVRESQAAQKAKDTDKAFKAKAAQEAQEARRQAEADKAWESREGSPGPSEDALWASREKQDAPAPTDWSDMDAIAAIQRELKGRDKASAILTKAPKLPKEPKAPKESKAPKEAPPTKADEPMSLHDSIMDAAWKITGDEPGAVPLDKLRAALPNVPRADLDKAMLALQNSGKAALSQYSSPRSVTPALKEAMVNYGGDDVHIFWPHGSRLAPTSEPLQIKVKPKATSEDAPKEAPETTINPDVLRIKVGDQVVERPKENIRNPMAYVAKTRKRMEERQSFADDLLKAAGDRQKPIVDALLGRLNNGSKSFEDAYYHVEEAVNALPEKQWGKFWDIYNTHEGRLKATYDN